MQKDQYKDQLTGPYFKLNSLEAVNLYVRNMFPNALVRNEGAGERLYFTVEGETGTLVAHTWMTGRTRVDWHVRVIDTLRLNKPQTVPQEV